MEHTKEPWKVIIWHDGERGIYTTDMGCSIRVAQCDRIEDEARIVTCINALEGWSNEELEKMIVNGGLRAFSFETVQAINARANVAEITFAEAVKVLESIVKKYETFDRGYSDYNQGKEDALAECAEEAGKVLSKIKGE